MPDSAVLPMAQVFSRAPRGRISGTLLVRGDPGGSFHLLDGMVTAVESPGAPDVETVLLRSGRVGEADWAAAFQAGAVGGRTGGELVARALVGAAELQLMCLMAVLDGAFAVGAGRIDGYALEPDVAHLPLPAPQGVEPEWLMRETERRIAGLASLRNAVSPFRDRMHLTAIGTECRESSPSDDRREILRRVNGRRTPRDIAFMLGRSLYAVTVELSRMRGEGLVAVAPAEPGPKVPRGPAAASAALPHRTRGSSGIGDVLPPRPPDGRRRALPLPLLVRNEEPA